MKPILITLALALAALPLLADAGNTALLLPLENLSANEQADKLLTVLLTKAMQSRGWQVIPPERAEGVLEENRVRYFDSFDAPTREKLLASAEASTLVSGTIYVWRDGENAAVGLSMRIMARDGHVLWGDVVALTASDTEGLLGVGRAQAVQQVAAHAVARLCRSMPRPGETRGLVHGPSKRFWRRGPPTFRSIALAEGQHRRVAILPFDTASHDRIAPRVVADLLAIRLGATGMFDVVDPAALRAAARAAGLRTFSFIGSSELGRLAKPLDTALFLRGSIYKWNDVPARSSNVQPEAQIEMSLVDVATSRILWNTIHSRSGADYEDFLLLGAVSNAVTLTDRMLSEMINAEAHTRPKGSAVLREPSISKQSLQTKGTNPRP